MFTVNKRLLNRKTQRQIVFIYLKLYTSEHFLKIIEYNTSYNNDTITKLNGNLLFGFDACVTVTYTYRKFTGYNDCYLRFFYFTFFVLSYITRFECSFRTERLLTCPLCVRRTCNILLL